MTEVTYSNSAFGYESEVITDKISAIQLVFDNENKEANEIAVAISVNGEDYVKNFTIKTNDKVFCVVISDDVEGLNKKILCKNEPVSISYL